MRKLASKMRDEVQEAESSKVIVRKEDKTINHFEIEFENIYNKYIRNIIKKRLEMNKNVK